MSTDTTNTTVQGNDDLTKQIQEKQEEELSYIREASNASDERIKYLAKKNKYNIAFDDGSIRTLTRKPLSNKKNKEIDELRTAFANIKFIDPNKPVKVAGKEFTSVSDIVYEAYRRIAEYCLGLTPAEYEDAIVEDDDELADKDVWGTRSIAVACLMKAVHGQAYFHKPSKSS